MDLPAVARAFTARCVYTYILYTVDFCDQPSV